MRPSRSGGYVSPGNLTPPGPSIPLLTVDVPNSVEYFTVTDNPPDKWILRLSTDGGATWADFDNNDYGNQLSDAFSSGNWLQAQRADASLVPWGPLSNIFVWP